MNCKFFPNNKDGFHFITEKNDVNNDEACLVYLYDHPDFGGVRHIAYMASEGAGIQPVSDLMEGTILIPVSLVPQTSCNLPTSTKDIPELISQARTLIDGFKKN